MIVIDASVAVEMLLPTPLGRRIRDRVLREERHAPHLIDLEFASAVRRLLRVGGLDARVARHAIGDMQDLAIHRHAHSSLLPRIWELRDAVSAYDAAYVALAEGLGAPLWTCDAKLSRAHGHSALIILLS